MAEITKDKADFFKHYEDLSMLVFYKEKGDKVIIKIAIPKYEQYCKQILSKIKD